LLCVASVVAGVGLTAAMMDHARTFLAGAMARLRPRLEGLVYVIGLGLAGLIGLDLFFLTRHERGFSYASARFHPFLTYHLPGTYVYSHAQERYVTDTRGLRFAQAKPVDTVRIVLSGASTMWGHYQDNSRCPARVLEASLRHADPGRRYEVLTVAVQGKYQLNELIDSVVTLPHWNPDLVISLNGFNEVWYGEDPSLYEGMPSVAPQIEAALELPPLPALFHARLHIGAALLAGRLSKPPGQVLSEPLGYEPPRYYSYLRQTAEALGRAGIPYAHSFCPSALEKLQPTPAERAVITPWRDLEAVVKRRRAIAARIVDEADQISFDAMAAFDTDVEVFQDLCHLNDVGVRRLADELVRHVPQWISRRPPVALLPRPEEFPPLGSPARVHLGAKSAADYLGQ
jgi:hypothetical protein